MRAKAVLAVLFLISLGVVMVVFLRPDPTALITTATKVQAREVLVATAALPAGTLLRSRDVGWRRITGPVVAGYIARPSAAERGAKPGNDEQAVRDVLGGALRHAVEADQPIPASLVVMPGDRDFLEVVLSPGARAVAIPVAAGGAGIGLLRPGDRADIILTQSFKEDTPLTRRSVSETVLGNLRVLAIDAPDTKAGPGNPAGRTVTFEASPEQAQKISVASELGKLSVTLRSRIEGQPFGEAAFKPSWASDVSPALQGASAPKPGPSAPSPSISVIRGNRREAVKPE